MQQTLVDWLEGYTQAFNALDGDAVAALYAEPCMINQAGRSEVWHDRAAVAANMRALCAQYREAGYVEAQSDLRQWQAIGTDHALLQVHWRIERAGELPAWSFHTAYQLQLTAQGWRVLLCIAYEERPLGAG